MDEDGEEEETEFLHLPYDPYHAVYVLKMCSLTLALTAIACIGCGIWTMVYAAPKLNWPYDTGSGVWTGVFTLVTGCLGTGTFFRLSLHCPERTRKFVVAFYLCVIMTFLLSAIHVIFAALGLFYCKNEILTFEKYCNREDRGRLMFISGMDIGFGIAILVVSSCTVLFIFLNRKLRVLIGTPQSQRFAFEQSCFFDKCMCYIT